MEDKDGISGSAVIIFVFLLFGSLIFWASKAELDNVTRGEGKIISSVQNQKIQSTESGVIQKRFVTENSFVDEGQILFVLDPVDTSSELNQLTKRLETLEIREQRLQSEIQGKVFDPKNSSEVSDITFLNTERSLFVLRQSELAGKLSILKDKKFQRQQELESARVSLRTAKNTMDLMVEEINLIEPMVRENLAPKTLSANTSLIQARKLSKINKKPILIADIWDNPGGGVAGDSTILIGKAISMNLKNIAVGSIWDPVAVSLCCAAGEKANIDLRFGGKVSSFGGNPINKRVLVKKIVKNAFQKFGKSFVPMGDSVCITFDGIEVILNSNRSQTFSTDLFTELGVSISNKKILIIKSTNHFYNSFFPHVSTIIYASVDGVYPNDPKTNKYTKLKRRIWPIVENPHVKSR